jgi:DNA mismatch repair protein MutS2
MVGRLRLRARLEELAPRSHGESKREKKRSRTRRSALASESRVVASYPASPGLELDLRGQTVEDALPRLEDYLDAAYMAGLPFVRIIHGKGTGALRAAIRDGLRGHPLVKNYARGGEKEGVRRR